MQQPLDLDIADVRQLVHFITPQRVAEYLGVSLNAAHTIAHRNTARPERCAELRQFARDHEPELRALEHERLLVEARKSRKA